MNEHKSVIIFTFDECDKVAFIDVHDRLTEQLASYKGIKFSEDINNDGCLQFGVYFDYDSKIPAICFKKTQINRRVTVSIFENSFISLLIIKDNTLRQFKSVAQDDLPTMDFVLDKERSILTFCFIDFIPDFKLYDKGDKL